ncbi:MMPL family transporter [Mycetocola spongiae]|uniref:MMPL family transporter n=1 Tax=Mycetocola spongiae TaxID=2859226 RepID=UPI001CF0FC8F|nr:efflux RND transporter permease subunit [Mycetocola spongiae]UCR90548.1 MMPL family transporter [Mycetocola spongiae]
MRIFLPAVLIIIWFAGGAIGGPYFGKVSEVSTNDQTSYLPASADATVVSKALSGFSEGDTIPAVILFQRDSGLTPDDRSLIAERAESLASVSGVAGGASPPVISEDGQAATIFVPLESGAAADTVTELRADIAADLPSGLESFITGPAGFTTDLSGAFKGIDGLLLLVALSAVFLILVIVYRSPLLPLLVLAASMFALCTALLSVWWLAKADILLLNGQVQGILFILVIGAATDYSLLYVSRYREALRDHPLRWDATWAALRGSLEPILASGGTVIAGLLCLLFSDLNSNKALGPVAAIGIAFSVLSALTFLPALLLACGRVSFWPRKTAFGSAHPVLVGQHATGWWPRLGRTIARRPRLIWIGCTVVLLAACLGVPQLNASGVAQSALVLTDSPARDGQHALAEHFPGGSGSPVQILTPESRAAEVITALSETDGLDGVQVLSADSPSGTALASVANGAAVFTVPGNPAAPVSAAPTVSEGNILLQATLDAEPDSERADALVRELRGSLDSAGDRVFIGGATATAIDSNDAATHDRNTIIPIVLVVILLILMLLLRSIIAPLILILTVLLSFGTALGVSAWVFNGVFNFPGADPAVPLYGFVFLVALGIDYNIFLMTRVREESLVHGTRQGILRGLSVTGGVITSAGVVLAATFAALGVIPILFLAQIAFIVAFGVLLDTLVVRSLLVPALAYDIGPKIWWPSKLARGREPRSLGEIEDQR